MATQLGGSSQFPDAAPSQLDPTAHGADYGFLDFTQQDGPAANGGTGDGAFPEFSAFSQVPWTFAFQPVGGTSVRLYSARLRVARLMTPLL